MLQGTSVSDWQERALSAVSIDCQISGCEWPPPALEFYALEVILVMSCLNFMHEPGNIFNRGLRVTIFACQHVPWVKKCNVSQDAFPSQIYRTLHQWALTQLCSCRKYNKIDTSQLHLWQVSSAPFFSEQPYYATQGFLTLLCVEWILPWRRELWSFLTNN